MYGLGSLLSSFGTSAIAPALTTAVMGPVSEAVGESLDASKLLEGHEGIQKFLSDAAGGTLGTALAMGLGAGLGAATGGSAGAAGGALSGLISGGGAAMQHEDFVRAMGLGERNAYDPEGKMLPGAGAAPNMQPLDYDLSKRVSGIGVDQMKTPPVLPSSTPASTPVPSPTPTAAKPKVLDKDAPSYFKLASELGMPALTMGMGLTSGLMQGQQAQAMRKKREQEEQQRLAALDAMGKMIYGQHYSEGGMTVSNPTNPPTTVKFPSWFVDEFAKSGGLQSLAHGGYINTQPFDPNTAHPQSAIPKAQHYPAASPIRNEVVDFADGGLLEGEGDGMSDDISANIDGQEEVRVADGEFVVPRKVAAQYGEDKLEDMMDAVRQAVHAKKGKQPNQDAAKKAFIRTMSGVKA